MTKRSAELMFDTETGRPDVFIVVHDHPDGVDVKAHLTEAGAFAWMAQHIRGVRWPRVLITHAGELSDTIPSGDQEVIDAYFDVLAAEENYRIERSSLEG